MPTLGEYQYNAANQIIRSHVDGGDWHDTGITIKETMRMAKQQPSSKDIELWDEYMRAWGHYIGMRGKLHAEVSNKIGLLKYGLAKRDVGGALEIIKLLSAEELKRLFGELLAEATFGGGKTEYFRKIILSLPREWLKENIEAFAEPLLTRERSDPYVEYSLLFAIYVEIDRDLAFRLATRAANSEDADIRETGQDLLESLQTRAEQDQDNLDSI